MLRRYGITRRRAFRSNAVTDQHAITADSSVYTADFTLPVTNLPGGAREQFIALNARLLALAQARGL